MNILLGLEYLSEAAQLAEVVTTAKPAAISDYLNLGLQAISIFDPALSGAADYKTAQSLMSALASAEGGQSGLVATIPFQSHGEKLQITVNVGPAA